MPVVLRRAVAILVLVASGGLLAGCGGAGNSPVATTTHTHAGSTTHARAARSPSKARAIAFASAVNLTTADVPGFEATSRHEPKTETATEKQLERELRKCTGGAFNSTEGLASASSKDFKLKRGPVSLSVYSEVSVARTAAMTARELAAIRSKHVRVCLSHYLNLLLRNQVSKKPRSETGIDPDSISMSVSQGTPPAPGASGSYAWLITARITAHGVRLPFYYIDILGFTYGPAEVSLLSSGALKRFPASAQEHLYRLLLERAKAHSL